MMAALAALKLSKSSVEGLVNALHMPVTLPDRSPLLRCEPLTTAESALEPAVAFHRQYSAVSCLLEGVLYSRPQHLLR
jgi:hypothetical protein